MVKQFLVAALIVSGAATASAQQNNTDQNKQTQPTQEQPSMQYNSRDYTQIQSTDVPASLRTTLQGTEYKGWESGTLYRNNSGNGYWLSTGTGETMQNYYFDKNGKAVQGRAGMQNDAGSNNVDQNKDAGTTGSGTSGAGSTKPKQ